MTEYRIVFNEQTGLYRVEKKHWWGWVFVTDAAGEDYLSFPDCRAAQRYVCQQQRLQQSRPRRWRVVDLCDCLCPGC